MRNAGRRWADALDRWHIHTMRADPIGDANGKILCSEEAGFLVRSSVSDSNQFTVTFPGIVTFSISFAQKEIGILPAGDFITGETIEHLLADQVLPRILAHEEQLVLHAGAVLTPAGAILLVGLSGSGKSTLAASLHEAGCPLLGDDAILIFDEADGPRCQAVYRSLRLFDDSIRTVFSAPVSVGPVAHYTTKQNVRDLDECGYSPSPVPIRAMFFLGAPTELDVRVRRMGAAEACMAIIEHSFWLDPTDVEQARKRFLQGGAVAPHFPVFELGYPRDFTRLDVVHETIFHRIGADAPVRQPRG
jgi:hypothetical protein